MKVGSIVECINSNWRVAIKLGLTIPKLKTPYTIRDISINSNLVGIRLEEIVNKKMQFDEGFNEVAFDIHVFRELQLPRELEQILNQELQLK